MQTGVMMFFHAIDDFGRVEHESIGLGGFGQAENAAGVFLTRGRDSVGTCRAWR